MSMNSRGIVPLRTLSKTLEPRYFNRVRLALRRLQNPLRIELPDLHTEMLLHDKAWICLSLETATPLLAWTDFQVHRQALHQPVPCKLQLFHVHAGLLADSALEDLDAILRERLNSGFRPQHSARVMHAFP